MKKETFTAFIDFSKTYDKIDRWLLWDSLKTLQLPQKFLNALQSLYENVQCSVRINGTLTDWFPVTLGLKQGCTISPTLFNLYINGLVRIIKESGIGIDVGVEIIAILLYADDIVLLAESQQELQCLLDVLHQWCTASGMIVNLDKSNVVHFRRGPNVQCAVGPFLYGESHLEDVDRYRYLSVVLTEFMDMSVTAKHITWAVHRALGLLIAKGRIHGGFPFEVFSMLYDSLGEPIMDYGTSVWGHKSFSCIDAVQNWAMRYFLRLGKRTPVVARQWEIG